MGFIKEFREFAIKGNLVDIAVAFVLGGAFGRLVMSFTDGIISPLVGLLTGDDLNDKMFVIKAGSPEVRDAAGNIISPAVAEVALKWGAFLTACINFIIVALVMFLVIKAINRMKRKQEDIPAGPTPTEQLLTEIRDAVRR